MARTYNVIDSDGHVLEPLDLWEKYIDPKFRDRAPRAVVHTDGKERLLVEGTLWGNEIYGLSSVGAIGRPGYEIAKMKYGDGKQGGFDPMARVAELDVDGIDAVVLYPSLGNYTGTIKDPELAAAACRAYNRWIADYCSAQPERLFGIAMLPMQSVELAVGEMRYARQTLGLCGGFMRPNPYNGRTLEDPAYDAIWSEAQELDFPIGFHEGTGGMQAAGADRVRGRGARHITLHTVEMMLAAVQVIWGGVCERFPKARFGFLESSGGWMPAWLDRMDRHYEGIWDDSTLKMKPSDYFKRQCWIAFEPVESTIAFAAEWLGADKLLWATDYPHLDGFYPGAPQKVANKLPVAIRREVMALGAMNFYGLK